MDWHRVFKACILLFSVFMFSIQMETSLENLMNPPIVVSEKKLTLSEIEPPMITICPSNQIDEEKLKTFGFDSYFDFLVGEINSSYPTNTSFWDIFNSVLTYEPRTDVEFHIVHEGKTKYKMTDFDKQFYPKFGYCWEITDYVLHKDLQLNILGKVKHALVFLTDKLQKTKPALTLFNHRGVAIELDKTKDLTYFIEIGIKSFSHPQTPDDCKDYTVNEYAKCIDQAFDNFTLDVFECQPPWLTTRHACTDMKWKENSNSMFEILSDFELLFKEIILFDIIEMKNFEAKKKCKRPCKEIRSLIRPGFAQTSQGSISTTLMFDEIVILTKDIVSYDFSNFLLDLGSSVGLWFGMSVLGLTDLGVNVLSLAKKTLKKIRK